MRNTEVAILDRAIQSEGAALSREVADFILAMSFEEQDHLRMSELARKAQLGTLAELEHAELDEYRRAGDLLALFHSRARIALKLLGQAP